MKHRLIKLVTILIILLLSGETQGQQRLWVGQSYKLDIASSIIGSYTDLTWNVSGGYISLSGSGLYRDITITQYFKGTATVEASWKYTLYYGDTPKTQRKTVNITCYDNPISIYPSTLRMAPGEVQYLSYDLSYDNQYSSAAKPYFSSGNSNISVTRDGKVTAKYVGTAYINVYSKSSANSPYCTVIVENIVPVGVSLKQANVTLIEGEKSTLTAIPTPSNATTSYIWSSEDTSIAEVNSSGVVTAKKEGTTRIKVTTTIGNYSAYCNITVKTPPPPPTRIDLKSEVSIYKGYSTQLLPILEPSNAETTYRWETSNSSVATVNNAGKITAVNTGEAKITVTTANNLVASCIVQVLETPDYIDSNYLKECISTLESLIKTTLNSIK